MALLNDPRLRPIRKWFSRAHDPLMLLGALALVFLSNSAPLWPAFAFMAAGEVIQLWATANLHKNKTLAETGPYVLMRNPMYVGRFILGIGLVLLLDYRWILLGPYVILFCLYVQARVLREEVRLVEALGQPYLDYCSRVPRWLPRLKPSGKIISWSWDGVIRNRQHYATAFMLLVCLLVLLHRYYDHI